MMLIFYILFFTTACNGADDIMSNIIESSENNVILDTPDTKATDIANQQLLNSTKKNGTRSDEENDPDVIPWDTFLNTLIKVSREQLEIVKTNIKKSYKLKIADIKQVDEAFNVSGFDYEQLLKHNLNKLFDLNRYNATPDFMVDFLDLSNYVLEQIIEFNLERVGGKLLLPTKWYKQVMRQKILRQQTKIATNFVEAYICTALSICKDRIFYTQYLTEWLRHLLSLSPSNLKELFKVIPDLLEKHMHKIKSTMKFRKTVKYIVNADDVVQRDTIDYIDEVLNHQKNVANLVPASLKKGAVLLIDLFKLIDSNYEISEENEDQLEDVSKKIKDWMNSTEMDIRQPLELMLSNIDINMKIWPLDVQNKIDIYWSQITLL